MFWEREVFYKKITNNRFREKSIWSTKLPFKMHQNASFYSKNLKNFLGRGHNPTPSGKEDTPPYILAPRRLRPSAARLVAFGPSSTKLSSPWSDHLCHHHYCHHSLLFQPFTPVSKHTFSRSLPT